MNGDKDREPKAPLSRVGAVSVGGETSLSDAYRRALIAIAQGSKRSKKVKFKVPPTSKGEKKGRK